MCIQKLVVLRAVDTAALLATRYCLFLTMPLRVHMEADAMWGTMTALGSCASPGFMAGSSSYTSRPAVSKGTALMS
jgi:hypothetical protein